jgi:hypothetical protein
MRKPLVALVGFALTACGGSSSVASIDGGGVADAVAGSTPLCCVATSGNADNVHCATGVSASCLPPDYVPPDAGFPPGYTSYNAAQCFGVGTTCTAWPASYGPCQEPGCCSGTVEYCE